MTVQWEKRYSSTLSLILALEEGRGQRHAWFLYSWETEPVPMIYIAWWALEPVWTGVENLIHTDIQTLDQPAYRQLPH